MSVDEIQFFEACIGQREVICENSPETISCKTGLNNFRQLQGTASLEKWTLVKRISRYVGK